MSKRKRTEMQRDEPSKVFFAKCSEGIEKEIELVNYQKEQIFLRFKERKVELRSLEQKVSFLQTQLAKSEMVIALLAGSWERFDCVLKNLETELFGSEQNFGLLFFL